MRYAIIEDLIIKNIIIADENFIAEYYPNAIQCPDTFNIGDKYENGEFSKMINYKSLEEPIE
jgi:hypothetical protein